MKELISNLYNYRLLLKTNVKKDIRGKYKASFLGILWSFITMTIMQGTVCILANAGIIKKVYFPREILPISINTSGLINFLISCLIIFIFLIASGIGFSKYILFLPIIIIVQYILQLGIILITSAVNIYIRDAEYIINFLVNMIFYATPIIYSAKMFEGTSIAWLIKINPMASIINSYRNILFYQTLPELKALFYTFLGSLILLFISFKIFNKLQRGFAEEV